MPASRAPSALASPSWRELGLPCRDARGGARFAVDELRDRGRDALHRPLGDLEGGVLVGRGHDERELVAAVAGRDVVRADPAAQRGADAAQDLVAGEVTVL